MRIAFYAPMKPPDHPAPSGDRRVARLLIEALERAGHEVELASRLRSRDGFGDPTQQLRLRGLGGAQAERMLFGFKECPREEWPDLWFTYHLYYKAPDWIGPRVAKGLGIPYVVAEASVANKRAGGVWDLGHQAVLSALEQAAAVITLNPTDAECLPDQSKVHFLRPFLDPQPYRTAAEQRAMHRAALAEELSLDPYRLWLVTAAMMRPGDKLASYLALAQALRGLPDLRWHLLIAGDGEARDEVRAAFAWARPDQIHFLGQVEGAAMPALYAACDLMLWPAINEAFGMALLEAQATGLPVVAGRSPGVAAIVRDRKTGILTAAQSPSEFSAAARSVMSSAATREFMAPAAIRTVAEEHGLDAAAAELDGLLRRLVPNKSTAMPNAAS